MRCVKIPCDDGTKNVLRVVEGNDGDIHVCIINSTGDGLMDSVRICTSEGAYIKKIGIRRKLLELIDEAEKAGYGES